jgi:ribosomal protein S13
MKKETKNKKTKDEGISTGAMVAIGASVAALAAGGYYFFGPEGKQHRGKLKGWMIRMKGEIVEKMENAKDLTQAAYDKIVDGVAAKYLKNTNISAMDVKMLVDRLKRDWKGIVRASAGTPIKKAAPKKTAAKKAPAKKAAAKKNS